MSRHTTAWMLGHCSEHMVPNNSVKRTPVPWSCFRVAPRRRRLLRALGVMFRTLSFLWTTRRSSIVFGVACVAAFVVFALWVRPFSAQTLPVGGVLGVVVSAGPLPNLGQCPDQGPNQTAAVRLASGRVIHASVPSAQTLQPGVVVRIRQWQTACNPSGYEVVQSE